MESTRNGTALRTISILGMAALLTSCSVFTNLFKLRNEIAAQYHVQNVSVSLRNGKVLSISLINASITDASDAEMRDKAKAIATWVKSRYPDSAHLSSINITFSTQKGYLLFLSIKKTLGRYSFSVDDLVGSNQN